MHWHDCQSSMHHTAPQMQTDVLNHNTSVHAVPHRLEKISCLVCVAVIPSVLVYKIGFKHVVFHQPQGSDMRVQYSVLHNILIDR